MTASPWFRFFASDWLGSPSVQMMSPAERGIYIQLLAAQWEFGPLPNDQRKLARLAGATPRQFSTLWPAVLSRFVLVADRLQNCRIEEERKRSLDRSELASENAAKSWKSHKRADAKADAKAAAKADAKADAHQVQIQSQIQRRREEEKDLAAGGPPPPQEAFKLDTPPTQVITRDAALAAIATHSAGRFVASAPTKGAVFKLDRLRKEHPDGEIFALVGRWLASDSDWRTAKGQRLDGRHLGEIDAWIAQAKAWSGAPDGLAPVMSIPGPREAAIDKMMISRERLRAGRGEPGDEQVLIDWEESEARQARLWALEERGTG